MGPVQERIAEVGGPPDAAGIDRDLGAHDPYPFSSTQGRSTRSASSLPAPESPAARVATGRSSPGRRAPLRPTKWPRRPLVSSAIAAQTPVHGHDDIPRETRESRRATSRRRGRRGDGRPRPACFGPLMQTAVQDGDGLAGSDKTAENGVPGRARPDRRQGLRCHVHASSRQPSR